MIKAYLKLKNEYEEESQNLDRDDVNNFDKFFMQSDLLDRVKLISSYLMHLQYALMTYVREMYIMNSKGDRSNQDFLPILTNSQQDRLVTFVKDSEDAYHYGKTSFKDGLYFIVSSSWIELFEKPH